jgi:hypothetical protein
MQLLEALVGNAGTTLRVLRREQSAASLTVAEQNGDLNASENAGPGPTTLQTDIRNARKSAFDLQ